MADVQGDGISTVLQCSYNMIVVVLVQGPRQADNTCTKHVDACMAQDPDAFLALPDVPPESMTNLA